MIPQLGARLLRDARRRPPSERAAAERFAEALLASGDAFSGQLLALLGNPSEAAKLRGRAAWLLQVLEDKRAIPTLLKIVRDRQADQGLRFTAIQALGALRSKRAVAPLIDILVNRDEDAWVRRIAANALGQLRDPRGRDALFRLAKDATEAADVRGDATEALANLGDVRSVPMLLDQLEDPSPEVRFWAVFALGCLAEPDVIPVLERVVATDAGVAPGWWSVKKEARDAIQNIKNRARQTDAEEAGSTG
jgi:HEAT repeat protein